jgi:DNA transformation protein
MGTKGDQLTNDAARVVQEFVGRVNPLGDITDKKMFGGYGVFESGKMFALVNSGGDIYLKVVDENRPRFDDYGAEPHGRMPYYQIPDVVLQDDETLFEWVGEAISLSKNS